jgi:hypothetical protein
LQDKELFNGLNDFIFSKHICSAVLVFVHALSCVISRNISVGYVTGVSDLEKKFGFFLSVVHPPKNSVESKKINIPKSAQQD